MSKKHFYKAFDDSVPQSFEKEYNRIVRQEEYRYEKDALSSAVLFGDESELYTKNIAEYILQNEIKKSDDLEFKKNMEYLNIALEQLKKDYPTEYEIINRYYFSSENRTMKVIGEEKNISKQAINGMLKRAYSHLKSYIISYKTKK